MGVGEPLPRSYSCTNAPEGTLYLAPDPKRLGDLHRLLITSDLTNGNRAQLPDAVDQAIKILREQGGDVMIRVGKAGGLVVRRGKVKAA